MDNREEITRRIRQLLDEAEYLEGIHCPRCAANRRYDAEKLENMANKDGQV